MNVIATQTHLSLGLGHGCVLMSANATFLNAPHGVGMPGARLIVDTRNLCRRAGFDGPHIVAA